MSNGYFSTGTSSPEMESAHRALDAALDEAATTIREAEELLARLETEETPRTDEEVQQFVSYVTGVGRTAEWDAIARRVINGEITWRMVADGTLARDPEVIEAQRSNPRVTTSEEIEALARMAARSNDMAVAEVSQEPAPHHRAEPTDDDDYFDNSSWFR